MERAKKRQNCNGKRKMPLLVAGLQQQGQRVYGDNVFEKHGINRDRTGDGEKPRCLCGKRGIFNRDGAANYQTT